MLFKASRAAAHCCPFIYHSKLVVEVLWEEEGLLDTYQEGIIYKESQIKHPGQHDGEEYR